MHTRDEEPTADPSVTVPPVVSSDKGNNSNVTSDITTGMGTVNGDSESIQNGEKDVDVENEPIKQTSDAVLPKVHMSCRLTCVVTHVWQWRAMICRR